MRDASVVGFTSSNSAAPPRPNTLPPQEFERREDIGAVALAPLVVGQQPVGRRLRASRSKSSGGQVDAQPGVARQDRGALDHVLQFAHVAGPVVLHQAAHVAFGQPQIARA